VTAPPFFVRLDARAAPPLWHTCRATQERGYAALGGPEGGAPALAWGVAVR